MHQFKLSGGYALFPIFLFLILFIGSGVYFSLQGTPFAFYQVSATVAILPAIILAIGFGQGNFTTKLDNFIEGVRDSSIITMCMIYLLAGAYTEVLKGIGGVEATVNLTLSFLPMQATLPGIFLLSAFIATAMGTSMGTIAAMAPIAFGIAHATDLSIPLTMGTVVGGAMFGDNLSLISDTTIAAVQTQGGTLKEKFKINSLIALPAMFITLIILIAYGFNTPCQSCVKITESQWIVSTPYFFVLALAISGVNVFLVLILGILSAGIIGLGFTVNYSLVTYAKNIYQGYGSMQEILVLSLLIGGLSHLTKIQGGLRFLIDLASRFVHKFSKKRTKIVAEVAIASIVSVGDICTANNTIAIILTGDATCELAKKYNLSSARTATLVDLFSCVFQGILPYSAQILLAGSIAGLSPLEIIPHVYYCYTLGIAGILAILLQKPRCYMK
ncbi:sodium:proton antiporter [Candidatus Paracaedimonas acanthamoebae]|nr:sodium:proton antiporter [Candidatus Paracaedimonas acanthamoebae]